MQSLINPNAQKIIDVAIVVSGPLDPGFNKYPTGYWGSIGGIGKKYATLNYSWTAADRDHVKYFYKSLP